MSLLGLDISRTNVTSDNAQRASTQQIAQQLHRLYRVHSGRQPSPSPSSIVRMYSPLFHLSMSESYILAVRQNPVLVLVPPQAHPSQQHPYFSIAFLVSALTQPPYDRHTVVSANSSKSLESSMAAVKTTGDKYNSR